ncbi:hypothetical protein Q4498_02840 [Neptunomonas phycophila]|uniref:hypothetical protein n=1 Tax=Neptunomonas phycophila TaxID=1572645 RepID=UPI0026E1238D|nr:hypothetical protein [Neptunomonas phycophila]MDO6467039.1 hypothetical protein [Neptunomonas phycophila]
MKREYGFPTQGEVLNYAIKGMGLLAQKDPKKSVIGDETAKKTLQKAINRLAKEESSLTDSMNAIFPLIDKHVIDAVGSKKVAYAMIQSLEDVLVQYQHLVRNEGSYLTRLETIRWAMQTRLIFRLVLSPYKNMLYFNVSSEELVSPNCIDWFLPDINENKVITPLKKAFKWLYARYGVSQTQALREGIYSREICGR